MLISTKYQPGTQKAPQQTALSMPAFTDTDHVHFPDGNLMTLPPYSAVVYTGWFQFITGGIRAIHAARLTGTNLGTYYLYGANNRLYAQVNNVLYNITPLQASAEYTLDPDQVFGIWSDFHTFPFRTENGSARVRLQASYVSSALKVGDSFTVSGVSGACNGIPDTELNGTHRVTEIDNGDVYFLVQTEATSTGVGPAYASSIIATNKVYIVHTAHGLMPGDRIRISGVTGNPDGVPDAEINKEHIVDGVADADTFAVSVTTTPTGFAGGGGAAVEVYYQIDGGNLDQGAAVGYGVGEYGAALYGQGGPSVAAQSFPRIWSFGNFGNEIVMCPGDYMAGDGQKIYIWDGDLNTAPSVLTNAPTDCNWITVVNNAIVALCGTRIDICEIGNGTVWTGLTTYTNTLQRVWKLVSCFTHTEKTAVIYTDQEALLLRYVGGGDLWDVSDLYSEDGILSPQSAFLHDGALRWRGARGFYAYDGGPVRKQVNTQNEDWIIANTNYGQAWKSFAMTDVSSSEWYHYFPAGADMEPGNYVIHNPAINAGDCWTLGLMQRTAAQRPGFVDSLYHMANGTSEAVPGTVYRHFTNGAVTFDWYAHTSLSYVEDGTFRWLIDQVIPDSSQSGDIALTFITREYPQGPDFTSTSYTLSAATPYLSVRTAGRLFGMQFSGSAQAMIPTWKLNLRRLGRRS